VIEIQFDGNRELRRLVRDFGKLPPALRKELRPALKRGAEPILAQSRANSSWSTRIPRATRISAKFQSRRGGVVIAVSAKRAPHARPYEGLSGSPFRHPVYGHRDRPWVAQATRPFLFKAVEAKGGAVTEELAETVIEIGRRHGWNR
jgi:hypothetical protein